MKRRSLAAASTFVTAFVAAGAAAAPPASPCSGPQWTQLDFWVGDWDATWPASAGSPAGSGTNRIEKILDGCVVSENFAGGGPRPLVGKSWSTFDARTKKWRQTWVDNQAGYFDFVGDLSRPDEKIFAMDAVGKDGKPVTLRMVFHHIAPDAFDWRWERSADGGKTWKVQWPIHYTRRKR
ncbi:MAG TPA: DUF1579 family protein [Thermoanaerobaculia bacterium]|nr:DUF1579 family protein [Thermoanaerobaculia bacterium]